jgi:hypothetical protein
MVAELILSRSKLERHFQQIEAIISNHSGATPVLDISWHLNPVVAGLVGSGCEKIERNRGARSFVAPAWKLDNDLLAWIGYREEWTCEPPAGATQRFSFRAISITVHFGYLGDLRKPQMFRAEWSGFAKWAGEAYSFQAANAGHPHWQFDAIDSLSLENELGTADQYLVSIRANDEDPAAKEFASSGPTKLLNGELKSAQKLSRVHFASATTWCQANETMTHTHAPATPNDLANWVDRSLAYIGEELERFV